MICRLTTSVLALVLVTLCALPARSQEPAGRLHEMLGKQEMERRLRIKERYRLELIKKAAINQGVIDALHYHIRLTVDPTARTIDGTVTATVAPTTPSLSSVDLDLYDNLTVTEVRENGVPTSFVHANDILTVSLAGTYAVGDSEFGTQESEVQILSPRPK